MSIASEKKNEPIQGNTLYHKKLFYLLLNTSKSFIINKKIQ